jgi:isoleucyl-tRNA synthetase
MNKMHGRENDSVEVVNDVPKSDVALREEAIQQFWQENDIFKKSLETPAGATPVGDFVFYDGPPFATGTPHFGHILASTIKDAIPRFWTMNGYRVPRTWGWDCHGLPLENLIEKELGLGTKRDIEEYGVKNFNEKARGAVMRYADDWKQVIPRMGRFVDMEHDYRTMDSTYTESVWWVFKSLHEKGLVFEGFKTMHLCPRCGTTLSNFEVNQGYKDIKDIAVTVKLPLLNNEGVITDTSLLVWTTTPWTLPGNIAAAVHNDIEYVKVKVENEYFVLAKGRLDQLSDVAHEVVEELKGSDLVGRKYQPPFAYIQDQNLEDAQNGWIIRHAEYVEVGEEGTGAVHIAPAYGDDDMKLAQEHKVPIFHHVDEAGHFKSFVTDFAGRLVKPKDDEQAGVDHKDTDIEVLKFLQKEGKIFKKENITHSYPHCWRCDTPLLNYATTSWFVNVPAIKDQLIAANNEVTWVPDHVGTNRFGKWLEGARDWAISRQRYWGAPLPIWRNPQTKEYKVLGSLSELQEYVPKKNNQYFIVRHAQAGSNVDGTINALPNDENKLTEEGRTQCALIAQAVAARNITTIVHSGLLRGKETAHAVAQALGLPATAVIEDARVIEYQVGAAWEGKTWQEFNSQFSSEAEKFNKHIPGSETRRELINRTGDFLYEFEATHTNENVLIVGHGSSLFGLQCVAEGADAMRTVTLKEAGYLNNGEVRALPFVPVPHNDNYELDFHRPYIDDIELFENGVKLERVPDVFDCWFESGSMPYAQHHFMGKDSEQFEKDCFPAEFIAEGLDQTRGWFYSLIVLGTALFGKSPFENVIVNGLVLAEDGKKMSKSLKNYPDPMELANRTGIDAMRFYLLSSPVVRGEDLNFSEKEVLELQRKNIGRLHNVLAMYDMFHPKSTSNGSAEGATDGTKGSADSAHVLDRWILARLQELVNEATAGYRGYELDKAARPVTDFIDDLSVWYVRRSRDRFKGDDQADKTRALATLRYVLQNLSLVMAPVMPFYAEYLWQAVKEGDAAESVHLGKWPKIGDVPMEIITTMAAVRDIVTEALEARTKANIKVRQPIASVTGPQIGDAVREIITDELNAKHYIVGEMIAIDTTLTPELIAEGNVRELMRAVQGRRKTEGLMPQDVVTLTVHTTESGRAAVEAHRDLLTKTVGASDLVYASTDGEVVATDTEQFVFTITKN